MNKSLKNTAHELRGMVADMYVAEKQPITLRPAPEASPVERVMHSIYRSLHKAGKLANRGLERKIPQWPVDAEEITVLGFGVEKIAYKLSPKDAHKPKTVVSIYHRSSVGKDPMELINKKRTNYETYRRYFDRLVVPTQFFVADNPWGDGPKPATIQRFIEDPKKLNEYTKEEVEAKAVDDPAFAADLSMLQTGYNTMIEEGYCPDFSSSNVVVEGSNIRLFDTGHVYPVQRLAGLRKGRPTYDLIESLAIPELVT